MVSATRNADPHPPHLNGDRILGISGYNDHRNFNRSDTITDFGNPFGKGGFGERGASGAFVIHLPSTEVLSVASSSQNNFHSNVNAKEGHFRGSGQHDDLVPT